MENIWLLELSLMRLYNAKEACQLHCFYFLNADRDRRGFCKYAGTQVIIRVSLIGNKRKSSC
jgi:hypothetical protein